MTADGFAIDLSTVTTLSTRFTQSADSLEQAFSAWQTGADHLRKGLAGLETSVEADVLAACKARQVLTVTGLTTWAAELLAWWQSMSTTDISNASDIASAGGQALPTQSASNLGSGGDELRR